MDKHNRVKTAKDVTCGDMIAVDIGGVNGKGYLHQVVHVHESKDGTLRWFRTLGGCTTLVVHADDPVIDGYVVCPHKEKPWR